MRVVVHPRWPLLVLALSLGLLLACDMPEQDQNGASLPHEGGDLSQIVERGALRAIRPPLTRSQHLTREGYTLDFEDDLIEAYAEARGLRVDWVYVHSRADLIAALLEGQGDLVAANLTVTEERKQRVKFTVPVDMVQEQIVTRVDDESIHSPADLEGRSVALRRSSSFWKTLSDIQQDYPGIELKAVPEGFDTEEIIQRVASGVYDVTVADSNLVRAVLSYRNDVKAAIDLTDDRPIAWAVRPSSPELLESFNLFLTEAKLADRHGNTHTGDLAEIEQRRTLRVLTRNNAATYFLYRGELVGFEYEFVKEFARQQGLRLEVIVPPNADDLLPWLLAGRGDLVAAALTPTAERRAQGASFSRPYNFVSQVVVAREGEAQLESAKQLEGRKIAVRRSSSYWPALEHLLYAGVDLELVAVPEAMETSEIIAGVARGQYDLTLADSHIFEIELTWRDDVKGILTLSDEKSIAWAIRDDNPDLLAAANSFIAREYRGVFYNVIYQRYFTDERRIRHRIEGRSTGPNGRLSPYDEIVQRFAEQYGFDWRLVTSVMYQESRFDPQALSFAGALGLMQVLPRTAEELGFDSGQIDDPETGIHAGVRYLSWVRDRFEQELPVRDRTWFTLAAYNAGFGHVRDARRIAEEEGLDPNRWFGNVERAMLLLSRPQYASRSRFGYCRCTEPVNYVRQILTRYNAYLDSTRADEQERAAL